MELNYLLYVHFFIMIKVCISIVILLTAFEYIYLLFECIHKFVLKLLMASVGFHFFSLLVMICIRKSIVCYFYSIQRFEIFSWGEVLR